MLKKLQAKPHHIKKGIALFLATIISGVIFSVWISSWGARSQGEETRGKMVSPLTGFSTMFEGFTSEMRDSVSGVPEYVENNISVATSTATTSATFDLSGVIVLDSSVSTTTSTSTSLQ